MEHIYFFDGDQKRSPGQLKTLNQDQKRVEYTQNIFTTLSLKNNQNTLHYMLGFFGVLAGT